jgi:hypothetical protein
MCHASKERVLLFGTDQRITSGPAARTAAFKGRIHGCTRTIRGNVRFFSCIAGAVHTWHLASFRCGAKVQTLLEVKRTCRDRGRGFDRSLMTHCGHRPDQNPAVQQRLVVQSGLGPENLITSRHLSISAAM